jgi:hypothetical protein
MTLMKLPFSTSFALTNIAGRVIARLEPMT